MKLMRSRIRLITFVISCALFGVLFWCGRLFLQETVVSPESSVSSASPALFLEPDMNSPSPVPDPEFTPPEELPPAAEGLYDTFGL